MVLDYVEIVPNPARRVELPERTHEDVNPPTAVHVEAILAHQSSSNHRSGGGARASPFEWVQGLGALDLG